MRVLKFGGTSVATGERILEVVKIVSERARDHKNPCRAAVFSAAGGVTDDLLAASHKAAKGDTSYKADVEKIGARHFEIVQKVISSAHRDRVNGEVKALMNALSDLMTGVFLVHEISPKTLDSILSFGERLSAFIICEALREAGVPVLFVDARSVIRTHHRRGQSEVDRAHTYKQIQALRGQSDALWVVTGFIASNVEGETTTLGRGGSDLTASLLGAALDADEIEIWTDVDGVMTADPRKVKEALRIPSMTYEEAMEMSHFGAKVIYPPTMLPALEKRIPLRIKNTFNPAGEGTLIQAKADKAARGVRGISSIDRIALMNVQGSGMVGVAGIAERLFKALAREAINIILISQASSEHSICVAIDPEFKTRAEEAVNHEFALEIRAGHIESVKASDDLSVVAVVGENMRHVAGVSGRLFAALGKNGISVSAISQGSSERNISLVIQRADVAKAIKCLHDAFFLSGARTLHLYLVGVGLIGNALLAQLSAQARVLREQQGLDLRVMALSNSAKMRFFDMPVELEHWKAQLADGEPAHLERFVERMIADNKPNAVFVDCTSSEDVTRHYERILKASISVCTPNKKANSSSLEQFHLLQNLSRTSGARFIYEANVGAGLPVLSTIKNLLLSGDRVLRIEAILSGTLSYLFNSLSKDHSFSAVVKDAKARGFTEPDPRDDLTGMDVARKLLILAREIGLSMELSDIQVESLLPVSERAREPLAEWLISLPMHDAHFEAKRQMAEAKGGVLRFVATLDGNRGEARLVEVLPDHPCYGAQGTDNVISITTERYFERPLVIKGPGAGADVTAAQVFADIIQVSNHLN